VRFFAAKALNVFARSNLAFGAIFLPNAHKWSGLTYAVRRPISLW